MINIKGGYTAFFYLTTMYRVIIYNHGKKVRVLNEFTHYKEAKQYYNDILKDNTVYFKRMYNWKGKYTNYELVLVAPKHIKPLEYVRNNLNALVRIKSKGSHVIKKISEYSIEEVFKDKIDNKMITFKDIIKKHLKKKLTYVVIAFNNKIVIEHFEDEDLELYVLKNKEDSQRLLDTIKEFTFANNLTNYIFFSDPTLETRKRLYNSLKENYGFSAEFLKKISTH